MWQVPARRMFPLMLMIASPATAWAMCCPGDIRDLKPANSGMGQPQPAITDLSLDPQWHVHAFERDGISYFQVGDGTDVPHFILGKAGSYFWVLPAGLADTQIVLPSDERSTAPMAGSREVLRHPEFTLSVYGSGRTAFWKVEQKAEVR